MLGSTGAAVVVSAGFCFLQPKVDKIKTNNIYLINAPTYIKGTKINLLRIFAKID